ncbi:MAG: TrmB family transcriptional regulator [Candidatus Thermoplasmatota archaeon]|nr:TrmB family transcriptional regulator [Candidatus Thermoplasmatota archaeon]
MDLKSAIGKSGSDLEELEREYRAISGTLEKLGLSEYEARAYVALVALGPSSANSVAEIAQIPRTSAYKVMISLGAKGFVRESKGRPRAFASVDPEEISKRFAKDIEESFSKVASVRDMLSEKGIPQLVYTILGKDRVLEKIGEMLDKSGHSFVMSSPSLSDVRAGLAKRLANAVARGVEVTIITSPFVKAPKGVLVIRRKSLIATDVISDGKTALIAAPDLSACGYTDNEALSKHLENFLRIMSESAE